MSPRRPAGRLSPRTATTMALGWWLAARGRRLTYRAFGGFAANLWAAEGETIAPKTFERQLAAMKKDGLVALDDDGMAQDTRERIYCLRAPSAALLEAIQSGEPIR